MKTTFAIMAALGVSTGAWVLLKKHNPECVAYLKGYFASMSKQTSKNIENMM